MNKQHNTDNDKNILLEVITPEGIMLSEKVEMVVVPGLEGELGCMYGHTPFVVRLTFGSMRIYSGDKVIKHLFIDKGYIDITNEKAVLLTDYAIDIHKIDVDQVKEKLDALIRKLDHTEHDYEQIRINNDIEKHKKMLELKLL
jgi:F-type H+-transporting ATPase subunit epsilon